MKKIITILAISGIFAGCSTPSVVQPLGEITVSYGKIINLREYVKTDIKTDYKVTMREFDINDENGQRYIIAQQKDSNYYYMGQRVEVTMQDNTKKVNPYHPQ